MKKAFPTIPSALVAILLLAVTVIAIITVFDRTRVGGARLDFTEHKIYTLSDGTRNILKSLDTPVTIRLYFTEGSRALPRNVKLYATRVKDFLRQYESVSNGKVKVEFIDVQPDTDAEDSARLDRIRDTDVSVTEKVYFGISVSSLDRKESLPRLDPEQETLLEYQVSRAITQVIRTERPKLGLMSGIPIAGNGMPPQFGGQQGWIIHEQIKAEYEVVDVPMDTTEIPSDIKALLVIHPAGITPGAEFAIDQFLLRGGKAGIFLDAHYYFGQQQQPANPMMGGPQGAPPTSTLPNLLKAWGLNFESGMVVADQTHRFSREDRVLTGVSLFSGDALAAEDLSISGLPNVFMILPGGFTGSPVLGLRKESLVHTTPNTQLFDAMRASRFEQDLLTEIPNSNTTFDMVARLIGRFPTAFPNGNPDQPASTDGKKDGEAKTADGADAKKEDPAKPAPLKEATSEGAVFLFADVDMIADSGAFQSNPIAPQIVQPWNGNFSLAMNVIDQLAGDSNLIGARSRPSSRRPFKVLEDMQAKAEEKSRTEITALRTEIREAEERLSQMLSSQAQKSGKLEMTPQMLAEEDRLNETLTAANKRLREIQKDLAREKEGLKAGLSVANIAAMPLLVALAGIAVAVYRNNRTAAR